MLPLTASLRWGIIGCVLLLSCNGLKQTLYMNKDEFCGKTLFNGDVTEGDEFIVKSNGWAGEPEHADQRLNECSLVLNFQNRISIVYIKRWWCTAAFADPSLEIYDNCDGLKKYPLVRLNCSLQETHPLYTTGPCVTIIHSRQKASSDYYFSLDILISKELVTFPVSAMAGIMVSVVVLVMVIIKVICVVTGFDNRLPKLSLTEEEEKKILEEAVLHVRLESGGLDGEDSCTLLVPGKTRSSSFSVRHSAEGEGPTCAVFNDYSQADYGYMGNSLDDDPPPRLKRYPSYKASSLFRK